MSTPQFAAALNKLKDAGISMKPVHTEAALFEQWDFMMGQNDDPTAILYIALGQRADNPPYGFYSDHCWQCDFESMEGPGSYFRIFDNIMRIANGDITFQDIDDYCNEEEDGEAWVSFTFEGEKYRWDLEVDNDWIDPLIFIKIQDIFAKHQKKGRLVAFPEGQSMVFSYLTPEEYLLMKAKLELRLHIV
ncbi:hypothetical protein ACE38W_06680 [Chitinophaga sp. Hz27]|uniref:hypothetical protein n=1 Tax=Chitinophaga sp. Hz27 TaxID=3347169 RepID=UPI0035E183B0